METATAAAAMVAGGSLAPALAGQVLFSQTPYGVWIQAYFTGFPNAGTSRFHGFHIHEHGACAPVNGEEFTQTGGHYNPGGQPHPQHAGDLPLLLTAADGTARMCFLTDRFRVSDIVGRAVIVHAQPDDFKTQPAGASGAPLGCGAIRAVQHTGRP